MLSHRARSVAVASQVLWGMPHDISVALSTSIYRFRCPPVFDDRRPVLRGTRPWGCGHRPSSQVGRTNEDVMFDAILCAALYDFSVWSHVLPLDGSATHAELVEHPYVSALWCPCLTPIQQCW